MQLLSERVCEQERGIDFRLLPVTDTIPSQNLAYLVASKIVATELLFFSSEASQSLSKQNSLINVFFWFFSHYQFVSSHVVNSKKVTAVKLTRNATLNSDSHASHWDPDSLCHGLLSHYYQGWVRISYPLLRGFQMYLCHNRVSQRTISCSVFKTQNKNINHRNMWAWRAQNDGCWRC